MFKILCSTIQLRDRLRNLKCGSIKDEIKVYWSWVSNSMCGKLSHLVNTWSVWRNRLCGVLSLKFKLLHTTVYLSSHQKTSAREVPLASIHTQEQSCTHSSSRSKCSCYYFFQRIAQVFSLSLDACLGNNEGRMINFWRDGFHLVVFSSLSYQYSSKCVRCLLPWTWLSWRGFLLQ